VEQPAYAADWDLVTTALDPDALETASSEGRAMTIDAAVAYASRGRGERKRPASGWASLTPTEREVVGLVAEGLRNADIADRLYVSSSTVKTHLSHVFSKLGVTTRAELAALVTRRS
jgi:DNA-binding NarL/FixJ family response regulator